MIQQFSHARVKKTRTILLFVGLLFAVASQGQLQFSSPPEQTQLIELYTSEGCSSCPPADRWLSAFKTDPGLWQRVIPIAFHVDYWDYIGWPDRFASPDYAHRQRSHKQQNNIRAVYTPGFVVDGGEWKGWWASRKPPRSKQKPGVLSITVNGQAFTAAFDAAQRTAAGQLSIAIVGFGLQTEVKAGENRGESLNHDFVVLAMQNYPGEGQWQGKLPLVEKTFDTRRLGLVAWISDHDSLVPVQAVGGWLD